MGNSFTTTTAGPGSGVMTIAVCRSFVRQFARNAGDSSTYSDEQIDRAIQLAADRWIETTKVTRKISTLTLSAGTYTLPTLPANFSSEKLLKAWVIRADLQHEVELALVDMADMETQRKRNNLQGNPRYLAFSAMTAGEVYPTPSLNFSLYLLWVDLFTIWTPGDAGAGVLTTNIPDDQLRAICTFGAPAFLQHTEPQNAYAQTAFQRFEQEMQRFKNRGLAGNITPASVLE